MTSRPLTPPAAKLYHYLQFLQVNDPSGTEQRVISATDIAAVLQYEVTKEVRISDLINELESRELIAPGSVQIN